MADNENETEIAQQQLILAGIEQSLDHLPPDLKQSVASDIAAARMALSQPGGKADAAVIGRLSQATQAAGGEFTREMLQTVGGGAVALAAGVSGATNLTGAAFFTPLISSGLPEAVTRREEDRELSFPSRT